MSNQSWNPDDRIEQALAGLKQAVPASSIDLIHNALRRRASHRRRLAYSLSGASVLLAGWIVLSLPGQAAASMATVVTATQKQQVYYVRTSGTIERDGRVSEHDVGIWQFRDHSVVKAIQRIGVPKDEVGNRAKYPPFEYTFWDPAKGKSRCYEPQFHYGVERDRGFEVAPLPADALYNLVSPTQKARISIGVKAHGGVFDEYTVQDPNDPKKIYVDHTTHLIRFVDIPRHWQPDRQIPKLSAFVSEFKEIRYPGQDVGMPSEPTLPANWPMVTTDSLMARFLRGIKTPVASQDVGGIKVTLYGVVVRDPGDVRAILTGGAPADPDDTRGVEVLNHPTRPYHQRLPRACGATQVDDPTRPGRPRIFLDTVPIAGREHVVACSGSVLIGKIPRELTIKVPVWRYDYGHPVRRPNPDHPGRPFYRSVFVGYATFKTTKVYEMPGTMAGSDLKANLPSGYARMQPPVDVIGPVK